VITHPTDLCSIYRSVTHPNQNQNDVSDDGVSSDVRRAVARDWLIRGGFKMHTSSVELFS